MKFCVIGLGRFGGQVAKMLAENNVEVLAIDKSEQKVEAVRDLVTQAICMNIVDSNTLSAIGIEEMDAVIIALGKNFNDTAILTRQLKRNLNVEMVIVRAFGPIQKEILELIGADQVIMPETEAALKLVDNLSSPIPNLTRITSDFGITQIATPTQFVGKTVEELLIYENYRVQLVGIKKEEEDVLRIPNPEDVIGENDILLFAGDIDNLKSIVKL